MVCSMLANNAQYKTDEFWNLANESIEGQRKLLRIPQQNISHANRSRWILCWDPIAMTS